jgi:hypothetical protein
MEAWEWIVVVAAVVVVLAVVAWALSQRRRRSRTLEGFGPEYGRAIVEHGDKRTAERDLLARAHERERLDIRPLTADAKARYQNQWQAIQVRFVDAPDAAIAEADQLLDEVLRARGYPVDDFDRKAGLISVDHPDLVEDYRVARSIRDRSTAGTANTEDRREALLRYRSMFVAVLGDRAGTDDRGQVLTERGRR